MGAGEGQAEAALTTDKTPSSKQGPRNHQRLIHWSSSNGADFPDNSTRPAACGIKPSQAVMSKSSGRQITL